MIPWHLNSAPEVCRINLPPQALVSTQGCKCPCGNQEGFQFQGSSSFSGLSGFLEAGGQDHRVFFSALYHAIAKILDNRGIK